jgi:hypothetical protein
MIRSLFLVHRYLGIAVGLLMVMWCLSGVVMMYVGYPDLAEPTRLRHLAPMDWNGCCKISDDALPGDALVQEAQVEMLGNRPVLRLRTAAGSHLVDLSTGRVIDRVSPEEAAQVARTYVEGPASAAPHSLGSIDHDQWTVSGNFRADRPLYHFGLNEGTELYISGTTGRAVQMTTTGERFWNWLGAIPHWLYFTELRARPSLWSNIVVVTSLMGCFLSAIGLYIGVTQFIHRPVGRWSSYQGLNRWHHIAGLVFGVLALSWIASGFLSMNPWGWLEGEGAQAELSRLRGNPRAAAVDLAGGLAALARLRPLGIVSVKIAPLAGRLYFITTTADGQRRRFNVNAAPAPLYGADLDYIEAVLGGTDASPVSLMTEEDAYYFSHHRDIARLPVYRMIRTDGTRYYLDALSGALIAKMDRGARSYRWFHQALHRLDFSAALRGRPQWDALMLLLMSGVTALCVTGAYLGYRRVTRVISVVSGTR